VKQNSSFFLICFSLFASLLAAQNKELEFFFSNTQNVRSTQNALNYQILYSPRSLIGIKVNTGTDERLSFAQRSRQASLQMDWQLGGRLFSHYINTGYDYFYDSSSLEQELSPYRNKTAFLGYDLEFSPADSLALNLGGSAIIRREEDRYTADRLLKSDGYRLQGSMRAASGWGDAQFGIRAHVESKDLDWEAYRRTNISAWTDYETYQFHWQQSVNWDYNEDDLYVLEMRHGDRPEGNYRFSDMQKRNSIGYNSFMEYRHPSDYVRLTFADIFWRRYLSMQENAPRNNTDLINQANLDLDVQLHPRLSLNSRAMYHYSLKDFSYLGNTRHTSLRGLSARLGWEYLPYDSLLVQYSIDLQRSLYPEEDHKWDNDLRTSSLSFGVVHYWKQRMRLSTWVNWSLKDDVYIDGILSSNNKNINSISLMPDCRILIGDRLSFNQFYKLRAEYTDYMYEGRNRSFYRHLGYRYGLTFDSFPLAARSGNPVWMLLPYRQGYGNAISMELSFGYEQNDYAENMGEYYLINSKNKRYSSGFQIKHDIDSLYYIVEPKYFWGTWQEYSLLLGLAWQFNPQSLLEFSLNPIGESLNSLEWRSSINLSLRY